jgi:hypothetical protein
MSHVPHELHDEFPGDQDVLHNLKLSDAHFSNLADKYHDTNREIHRIEAEVEAASDDRLEDLKKQRLRLVDEIGVIVRKAKTSA